MGKDILCDISNRIPPKLSEFFTWKKDNLEKLGPGLAQVFYDEAHKTDAMKLAKIFDRNLGLETEPAHFIEEMDTHLERGIF
jgi:hypothetical protein